MPCDEQGNEFLLCCGDTKLFIVFIRATFFGIYFNIN